MTAVFVSHIEEDWLIQLLLTFIIHISGHKAQGSSHMALNRLWPSVLHLKCKNRKLKHQSGKRSKPTLTIFLTGGFCVEIPSMCCFCWSASVHKLRELTWINNNNTGLWMIQSDHFISLLQHRAQLTLQMYLPCISVSRVYCANVVLQDQHHLSQSHLCVLYLSFVLPTNVG